MKSLTFFLSSLLSVLSIECNYFIFSNHVRELVILSHSFKLVSANTHTPAIVLVSTLTGRLFIHLQ